MRTSIRFRLITAICAATLLIAAFSFLPVPVQADTDAEKAIKKAEEEVAKAEQAAKEDGKAQKDADEAMKKTGAEKTPEDKAADDAAKAADAAAQAADEAQDKAQKEQLEAEDAALDAKSAGGNDEEKNKKAADEKKEADDAAAAAKEAEEEANKKEKESNEADKKADGADKKIDNRDVKKKKADARLKRKRARAARRAAAKAIRDAKRLLHEATRVGESSESKKRKKRLEELEERLKGLKKLEEDARKSEEPLRNFIPPGADQTAESKTANGLHTVTFDTLQGRVIVNLPDHMRAGDRISGTVIAEPKGQTEEERAKNRGELSGYVVELKVPQPSAPQTTAGPSDSKVAIPVSEADKPFTFNVPTFSSISSTSPPRLGISLSNPSAGSPIVSGTTTVHIQPAPSVSNRPPTPTANDYQLPKLGQQGRPVEIPGPFDGSFENTTLKVGGQDVTKLTESPRNLTFQSPTNVTGPVEIVLKEGNVETKGQYRNVGVRLTAPKTNLLKGENTSLTVRVEGLQGISQDVPLRLEKSGVVTMQGGDVQTKSIKPNEVQADGSFTMTRRMTGQQAGAFSVTATVVGPGLRDTAREARAGGVLAKGLSQNQKDAIAEHARTLSRDDIIARLEVLRAEIQKIIDDNPFDIDEEEQAEIDKRNDERDILIAELGRRD